jgi:hypothetical protein
MYTYVRTSSTIDDDDDTTTTAARGRGDPARDVSLKLSARIVLQVCLMKLVPETRRRPKKEPKKPNKHSKRKLSKRESHHGRASFFLSALFARKPELPPFIDNGKVSTNHL